MCTYVSDCRCQGVIIAHEMKQGRTNWDLFKTLTTNLLDTIKQHHKHKQVVTVSDDPKVNEVVEWLKALSLTPQADIAKQAGLTFDGQLALAVKDAATMRLQVEQLQLSGNMAKVFESELKSHYLEQSIQDWLNKSDVDMGEYYAKFKAVKCHTFKALFDTAEDDDLFTEVLTDFGIEGLAAKVFKRKVKAKRADMLGTGN